MKVLGFCLGLKPQQSWVSDRHNDKTKQKQNIETYILNYNIIMLQITHKRDTHTHTHTHTHTQTQTQS